uniref:NADH dehydrogenase subunit 6 n=1 Tax=Simulium quinquestriatum TaxID=154791 RepID=A0A411NHK7_9DIPT|nr:NADH dehydrogenase subunit 6 [Simulium quinquestriatum]
MSEIYFNNPNLKIFTSFNFNFKSPPLTKGFMLLTPTSLISIGSSILSKTFWISYNLINGILSSMMVAFIYGTFPGSKGIINNNQLKQSNFLMMTLITTILNFNNNDNFPTNSFLPLMDNTLFPKPDSFIKENMINLNKLYNYPTNFLTIILINYLFLTLIAVVKVTNIFYGPLRPRN